MSEQQDKLSWASDFRLPKPTITSSTIALLGFVAVCIAGGYNVYFQNKATENALRVSQARSNSASQAQAAILIMGKAEAQLVGSNDAGQRHADAVLAIKAASTLDESIQRLQTDLAGNADVRELSRLLETIDPAKMRVIRDVSVNDVAAARSEIQHMQAAMTRIELISQELVQGENERVLLAVVNQGKQARRMLLVLGTLATGCVILGMLAGRRLSVQQSTLETERKILRVLIDTIPDAMYVKDRLGRFLVANAHLAHLVGASNPEELIGKTDFDFFPRELATLFYADEQQVMRSGQPLSNHEETGMDDGREICVLTTKVPLRDSKEQVTGIAGVGRDIGERKKSEKALRAAHHDSEIFINAVPSILISVNRDSQITRWNSAASTVFGLPRTEALGKQLSECGVKWLHPDMAEEIRSWCSEQGSRRCDLIPFSMNGETRLLGLTVTAVHVTEGNSTELLVIGSDVTYRSALEAQLRQSQKLESVGQLAAGIAHEINTPTQYIGDNVRFLKDAFSQLAALLTDYDRLLAAAKSNTLSPDAVQEIAAAVEGADAAYLLEEIPKAIEQTLEGVTRVATLVSAMKEFSHPGTKEKVPLDLNHAIESTITVARNEWKYVAELETDFDPSLPQISCQAGEFNQVILNLIVNAAHAIADVIAKGEVTKGLIKIQTRNYPECAEIRIQDTGMGIPEGARSRIFDPFFTTKAIGKGTGQGLAIAHSVVVDKHKGSIQFETEDGKGTTFIIRLPHDGKTLAAKAMSA
jgi:PAS domain S-box-containing protein